MVDDLNQVAAGRPISGVVSKGVLAFDRPVSMNPKASLRLGAEVVLEQRARPDDEPIELRTLRAVEAGG